jgi:hypothetical protein
VTPKGRKENKRNVEQKKGDNKTCPGFPGGGTGRSYPCWMMASGVSSSYPPIRKPMSSSHGAVPYSVVLYCITIITHYNHENEVVYRRVGERTGVSNSPSH